MDYIITAKCRNGHTQELFVDGMLGIDWVKEQADLIDGTSSLYLVKPADDPESIIGKCGICKAQFFCNVTASHTGKLDVKPDGTD